jgi:hypothetical protein
MKTIDFEDFLSDKCDTHTNNDPAGFERWLEQLDIQELQDYGQEFGEKCYLDGKQFVIDAFAQDFQRLKESNDKLQELLK